MRFTKVLKVVDCLIVCNRIQMHTQIIYHFVYFFIPLNDFTLFLKNTGNKTRLNSALISKSLTVAKN